MPTKSSRTAFFVAWGSPLWPSSSAPQRSSFNFRDHTQSFRVPAIELSIGVALLAFTLLAESPGRSQRLFLGLRNALIGLFCVAVLLVFLYGLVGPLR
jgi:hypothetical protein